ncbi:MAG: hypothetical protein HY674_09000, partial [Chloroflexi bacterium]|nr:hypothetical protein [Chloroflexota bacterium]
MLESVEALQQRYDRRPHGPLLYEIQVGPGPNRIVEKLDGMAAVHAVPRLGEFRQDLERLLAGWNQLTKRTVGVRESLAADDMVDLNPARETSLQ